MKLSHIKARTYTNKNKSSKRATRDALIERSRRWSKEVRQELTRKYLRRQGLIEKIKYYYEYIGQ